jgi:hypothetical protein
MVVSYLPTIQSSDGLIIRRSLSITPLHGKQKRRHQDAVLPHMCYVLATVWVDVSECYRGELDLWLPDQGSNLGPAD